MLLVDDTKEIAEVICFYCHSTDIDCDCITEGWKALDSIKGEKYDLILLDLAMPGFSGLDVIKSLKEEGGIESKNIVIFTASSVRNTLDKIEDSGIKEILKKPCSLDDLTELIERYRPRQ
jgi:two-component system, OmpR family, response regulator